MEKEHEQKERGPDREGEAMSPADPEAVTPERETVAEAAASGDEPSTPAAVPQKPPGSLRERLARWPFFRTRRRAIITLLVAIPLILCLGSWLLGFVVFADTAKLIEMNGLVHTHPDEDTQWVPASLNQLLSHDDWLRTGTSSGAQLLFFDVSTVALDEETEVRIDQIGRRRGGKAIDVVLDIVLGSAAVRAVRFVDPSSSFRVDTPTSSTVVRGARFTVQVEDDGATQIDLQAGSAEVSVGDEVITLGMGQRITLEPNGLYTTTQVFEPNADLLFDKLEAAWNAPGDALYVELTETEINQFLAAMSSELGFPVRDTQIWLIEDEVRLATTVTEPTEFDLSAAIGVAVEDGEIALQLRSVAAGIALPIPRFILEPALDLLFDQFQDYLDELDAYVLLNDIQIEDGRIIVTGTKLAGE